MPESNIQFSVTALLLGLASAAMIAGFAWRLRMLSLDGWLSAALLGGATFGFGGLSAALLLIAFFGTSSLLSKLFTRRKVLVAANFAKGGQRDWAQVLANGGAAALSLIMASLGWISESVAWIAFVTSLATVTADTWATEIGVLSAREPILITTGKRVAQGTSGGISWLGSLVAFLAAMFIGILAWLFGMINLAVVPAIAIAGLVGSFIDSLLGATVQAIYYCPACEKETERHPLHHCGTPTTLHHGWRWLDNDWVNFLSSTISALLAATWFAYFV